MENFEDKLTRMTKPEVTQLKHQNMLANSISKAKDGSVLSLWWLSIPLYIIAVLLMKTVFMPHTTLFSNLHDLTEKNKYSSLLVFLLFPLIFITINIISIRKTYFLLGSAWTVNFFKAVWANILVIICSIIVLIIYSV